MKNGFKISFNEAVDYIKNFVQHEELRGISRTSALGGVIPVDSINGALKENLLDYTGNMAWFCYNPDNTSPYDSDITYPKLFLSFEEHSNYKKGQRVPYPSMENLSCPVKEGIFTYDDPSTTREGISDYIINQKLANTRLTNLKISREFVEHFNSNYKVLSRPGQLRFNPLAYGFFENKENNDVLDFLTQDENMTHVRYFFGFSNKKEHKNSKIRIILFGVNKDGQNLIPSTKDRVEVDVQDNYILQKSWPPPDGEGL